MIGVSLVCQGGFTKTKTSLANNLGRSSAFLSRGRRKFVSEKVLYLQDTVYLIIWCDCVLAFFVVSDFCIDFQDVGGDNQKEFGKVAEGRKRSGGEVRQQVEELSNSSTSDSCRCLVHVQRRVLCKGRRMLVWERRLLG